MCAPMMGAALGVLSAVAEYGAASADYNAKAQVWKQNYKNSLAAGREEQNQITLRTMQEQEAKDQKLYLMNLEEVQKKSEAQLAASEAGVGGLSVQSILVDIGRRGAYNRQIENRNWAMTAAQLEEEQRATVTTIKSRINSVERPTAPNPLAYVVKAAGAVMA